MIPIALAVQRRETGQITTSRAMHGASARESPRSARGSVYQTEPCFIVAVGQRSSLVACDTRNFAVGQLRFLRFSTLVDNDRGSLTRAIYIHRDSERAEGLSERCGTTR